LVNYVSQKVSTESKLEYLKKFISNWGGKSTIKIVKLSNKDDKYSHVLAGDIISPNQTEHAKKTMVNWIKNLK